MTAIDLQSTDKQLNKRKNKIANKTIRKHIEFFLEFKFIIIEMVMGQAGVRVEHEGG